MKIEKKIWPHFFEQIQRGDKTFELRLADFDCRAGDKLLLREWSPKTKNYTGRSLEKEVGYVLKTKDVNFWPESETSKYGYQIISLK